MRHPIATTRMASDDDTFGDDAPARIVTMQFGEPRFLGDETVPRPHPDAFLDPLERALIASMLGNQALEREDFPAAFDQHHRALELRTRLEGFLGSLSKFNGATLHTSAIGNGASQSE